MKLTVGSLFAGIGGLELGLEATGGFRTVWQVEKDQYANRVLEKHWPDARRWDDVRTFPPRCPDPWLGAYWRQKLQAEYAVDLICGGFPCQDISFAGKGAGLSGSRSGLWYEFARIVGVVRPRFVIVENVAALLVRGLDAVLGTLASLGYDAEWHCIPASYVGAPHIRDRAWIIGIRWDSDTMRRGGDSRPKREVQDESTDANRTSQGIIALDQQMGRPTRSGEPGDEKETGVGWREFDNGCSDVPETNVGDTERTPENTHPEKGGSWGAISQSSWWATEPDVGRVAHGVPSRVHRLRCLGNAVVPQVAEFIGRRILETATRRQAQP